MSTVDIGSMDGDDEPQSTKDESFENMIHELTSPSDARSVVMAAVTSALLASIEDKLLSSATTAVTPMAVFLIALKALESAVSTMAGEKDEEKTAVPLLEILRRVTPHVAKSNPNVYEDQFRLYSRILIAVVTSAESSGALKRQCLRTAAAALSSATPEKKSTLFRCVFLDPWKERTPKIRKEAEGCILRLLPRDQQISHQLIHHSRAQLTNHSHVEQKAMLHLLLFLQRAIPLLPDTIPLGNDLCRFLELRLTEDDRNVTPTNNMMINLTLSALSPTLSTTKNSKQTSRYAFQVLTVLLRHSTVLPSECRVLYARSIASFVLFLDDKGRKQMLPQSLSTIIDMAQRQPIMEHGCLVEVERILHHPPPLYLEDCVPAMQQLLKTPNESTLSLYTSFLLQLYAASILRKDLLLELVQLHSKQQVAVEHAISTLGTEMELDVFLSIIPLSNGEEDAVVMEERAWLLPQLKSFFSSSKLTYFQNTILRLARICDRANLRSRVLELWALFPCFCHSPLDLSTTLLVPTWIKALNDPRYPELTTIICTGLKRLGEGVLQRKNDDPNSEDVAILSQASVKLLPVLFQLVETLYGRAKTTVPKIEACPTVVSSLDAQCISMVTDTIGTYASLCPPPFLQGLFKKMIERLLIATTTPNNEERICTLLELALALVQSKALDEGSIDLVYRAMKPLIRSDDHDPRVQKRAYKVMADVSLCQQSSASSEQDMILFLIDTIVTCHVSARYMRLKCLTYLMRDDSSSNITTTIPKIMGEVLLCLKDSNTKTREAAFQLLLQMSKVMPIEEFLQIVLAALGGQTAHMRSAAVLALSRLVYEYSINVQSILPSLLQTVLLLGEEKSNEVLKSMIGFVRVSIAVLTKEQLEPSLPNVVDCLMQCKKIDRRKIKIILKKLVRLYGYETLLPLMPEKDTRLITHIRKLAERSQRKRQQQQQQQTNVNNSSKKGFDVMMDSDEEDSDDDDDGRTLMTGITRLTDKASSIRTLKGKNGKSIVTSRNNGVASKDSNSALCINIKGEKDGHVLDMLDPKNRIVPPTDNTNDTMNFFSDDDDDDSVGAMEFDDSGRLIVPDSVVDNDENRGEKRQRRVSKLEEAKAAKNSSSSMQKKSQQPPKKKGCSQPSSALGAAYKSKKAGGDVKRRGQLLEPYAYVPLDGRAYTKKNREHTVARMSTIVKSSGTKRKRK